MTQPIVIREARETDMPFIAHSWRTSFEGAPAVRTADREHLRTEMDRVIGRLCSKATVRVACDAADPDTIVGFAVYEAPALHYVYVKQAFRKNGIAKLLTEGAHLNRYTFQSNYWHRPKGWLFTPRFTL